MAVCIFPDGYLRKGRANVKVPHLQPRCVFYYPVDVTAFANYYFNSLLDVAKGTYPVRTVENCIRIGPLEARDQDGRTVLHRTVIYGQPGTLKLLLEAGADIEAKDNLGQTPLHLAACYRVDMGIVTLLIDNNANPNALDKAGKTPLVWAESRDYLQIAGVLKKAIDIIEKYRKAAAD